jgi:hypothetical protein
MEEILRSNRNKINSTEINLNEDIFKRGNLIGADLIGLTL